MNRETQIRAECQAISDLLVEKNRAYGDSALSPVRIFSKADPVEQIKVRLDDKISRLARGSAAGEDVILDLIGYLVLLRIAQKEEGESGDAVPIYVWKGDAPKVEKNNTQCTCTRRRRSNSTRG